MVRQRLPALILALVLLLASGGCWAQTTAQGLPVSFVESLMRWVAVQNAKEKEAFSRSIIAQLESQATEFRRNYFQTLINVTVSVEDNKGHTLIGAPVRVTATIKNSSNLPVYIRTSDVKLSIPARLNYNGREMKTPENLDETWTRIDPGSNFEVVWDQDPRSFSERVWANLSALDFKPDNYPVNANIQIHYDLEDLHDLFIYNINGTLDFLSRQLPVTERGALLDRLKKSAGNQKREFTYLTRVASQEIFVDFMPLFVAFCAIPGGIFAVLIRWLFKAAAARAILSREYPALLRCERQRLRMETVKYLLTALFLPFIGVAAAKATHNVDWGMALRVYDVLGAVVAGFTFQFLAMKYGEPMLDKLVERHYPG